MSSSPDSPVQRLGQDSDGRTILLAPYEENLAQMAVGKSLADQTDTDPEQVARLEEEVTDSGR
jgi:hypothetical protein